MKIQYTINDNLRNLKLTFPFPCVCKRLTADSCLPVCMPVAYHKNNTDYIIIVRRISVQSAPFPSMKLKISLPSPSALVRFTTAAPVAAAPVAPAPLHHRRHLQFLDCCCCCGCCCCCCLDHSHREAYGTAYIQQSKHLSAE